MRLPLIASLPARRRLAAVVLAAYMVALAVIIFGPVGTSTAGDARALQIELSLDLSGFIAGGIHNQNLQNLLLTVPFGALLPLVFRWGWWRTAAACAVLPVALEGGQWLIGAGLGWGYRSVDINDWLANTLGGLVGLSALTLAAMVSARRGASASDAGLVARPLALLASLVTLVVVFALAIFAPAPARLAADLCERAVPASAARPLPGYVAYVDRGQVCVRSPIGSSSSPPGSADLSISVAGSIVTVLGQSPRDVARVVVTAASGQRVRAAPMAFGEPHGWRIYAAQLELPRGAADPGPLAVVFEHADGTRTNERSGSR